MSGRHAPGPWSAVLGGDPQVVNEDGTLAKVASNANARLMAAAPELLEALEMMLENANRYGWDFDSDDYRQARAACNKAKGES